MSSDRKQLNLSLTETEWKEIDALSSKTGLEKKELILRALRESGFGNRSADYKNISSEVRESIKASEGAISGFHLSSAVSELENHGLVWSDLTQGEKLAVLRRYKEHASFWGYGSDSIRKDIANLSERLKAEEKAVLRMYYTISLEEEKKEEESEESSSQKEAENIEEKQWEISSKSDDE